MIGARPVEADLDEHVDMTIIQSVLHDALDPLLEDAERDLVRDVIDQDQERLIPHHKVDIFRG